MMRTNTKPITPGEAQQLFTSPPPCSIEAEAALLGSILVEPAVLDDVVQVLRGEGDFFKSAHSAVYSAMVQIHDRHGDLDIVQLHQHLVDRRTLEAVGGKAFLVELANSMPSAANALSYARQVKDKAILRDTIEAASLVLRDAHDNPDAPADVLDRAEQALFDIAHRAEQSAAVRLPDLFGRVIDELGQDASGEARIFTGLADLDAHTGGLRAGDFIILAARPSIGKTALALTAACNIAANGTPAAVFSMEMTAASLAQRVLSADSAVSSRVLQAVMLTVADFEALHRSAARMIDLPLFVDDTPGLTPLRLRAKARRVVARYRVRAVFIDYLQLMTLARRVESRQIEVGELSRQIKALARELNVPIVCLSQLNRAAEYREDHRPRLSDLRDSGSIEQDADIVLLLHRESCYHRGDSAWAAANEDKLNTAELIIAKHRNGPTGTIKLNWDASTMRFRDHAGINSGAPGEAGS
ncbi:MAG: replicative DNA helicase [Planctomycetota bacterium]|nr:replicative DNA helicase [Planctomycetota bacterium]